MLEAGRVYYGNPESGYEIYHREYCMGDENGDTGYPIAITSENWNLEWNPSPTSKMAERNEVDVEKIWVI